MTEKIVNGGNGTKLEKENNKVPTSATASTNNQSYSSIANGGPQPSVRPPWTWCNQTEAHYRLCLPQQPPLGDRIGYQKHTHGRTRGSISICEASSNADATQHSPKIQVFFWRIPKIQGQILYELNIYSWISTNASRWAVVQSIQCCLYRRSVWLVAPSVRTGFLATHHPRSPPCQLL